MTNDFCYRHYQTFLIGLVISIFLSFLLIIIVLYQVSHRPLPSFIAVASNGQQKNIQSAYDPNLLPTTLTAWANKAAVAAYTYDFVNYSQQMAAVRPYFTEAGWRNYESSIESLITRIQENKLFVNGVVTGVPVISNQGELPGHGYTWRIQIPFLVTYQSAETTSKRRFLVKLTIVRIPTYQNPQAIGIDQFVMQ